MADQTRTLFLLQQISDLMGVDRTAFTQLGSPRVASEIGSSVIKGAEVPTLQRLVRAYRALTTDEARTAAIRTIEALATPELCLAQV